MPKKIKQEDRIIISIPEYNGPGIYMIKNNVTGRLYIGSAVHIHNRIKEHDQYMRKGWCNNRFQEDIDKGHKFTCTVIEKCTGMMFVELRDREEYYIKKFDCYNIGYNSKVVPTYDLEHFIKCGNKHMIEWLTRKV